MSKLPRRQVRSTALAALSFVVSLELSRIIISGGAFSCGLCVVRTAAAGGAEAVPGSDDRLPVQLAGAAAVTSASAATTSAATTSAATTSAATTSAAAAATAAAATANGAGQGGAVTGSLQGGGAGAYGAAFAGYICPCTQPWFGPVPACGPQHRSERSLAVPAFPCGSALYLPAFPC
eukprot:SAG22_NODE_3773_length_1534_cov_10.901742_2_plen_178_part_00